ncbi:putative mitochondrial-processing peptidase subunit beta [Apostasia shenzhenica]|uniref:Putative mitochondrial-processing peptidase subunit beta n=1 Tax=Apostasia shenzhenica TaxID=1088818 RepID=A0A2I0B979_9ASPA|nr:putative mitochondrial-processing peptidase subunit beta [Apostasia shenzhenica]
MSAESLAWVSNPHLATSVPSAVPRGQPTSASRGFCRQCVRFRTSHMAMVSPNFRRKVTALASAARLQYLSISAAPTTLEESIPDPRFLRYSSPEPQFLDHSPFLLFPQVHVSTLPNGIRVVTQAAPVCSSRMCSIGVWIDAGSRFEAFGTNGTAHFLEHMIFKGTKRRTAQSLEEEIENLGARLNAYTSREQTTFFADVQSKDTGVAVDVLADILQNSRFPEHAIKRERGVILREMEEVQGQLDEVIFDHLHAAAFYKHPLGDTILGPKENIRSISRVDLEKYISTHYTGPRMVVSAAGAVKHDEIVSLVRNMFTKFSMDPTTADELVMANPAIFTASEVRMDNDTMPLVHLAVTLKGTSWTDANSIPLMVIQTLLGSWNKAAGVGNNSGSELARRISTDGLAESIMAFNTNYRDTGLFGVYCTTTFVEKYLTMNVSASQPDCIPMLSLVVMQEIRRLAYEVSEIEVTRARNQLKSCLLLHIDGSTAVAENNGRQMLTYGRVVSFPELFARIDAVDATTIKDIARKFIINQDVAVAAMGPLGTLPELSWFQNQIFPRDILPSIDLPLPPPRHDLLDFFIYRCRAHPPPVFHPFRQHTARSEAGREWGERKIGEELIIA